MGKAIDCVYSDHGKGPAIIMVHGIGARRSLWDPLAVCLKDQYRCISYDLRGHGESPMPEDSFGLDDLVDDLEALRRRLGIGQAHIIGHSLGGMIGPAYARRYPEHVLSLGLFSTAAFRTDEDAAKVKAVVATMTENGVEASLDMLVTRWFSDDFMRHRPDAIALRKRQVIETNPKLFLNVFDIYAQTEMSPWLAEVTAPALVLTGELDGGCSPRLNRQIAAALPNSELVVLDSLKHAILIEAPDQVMHHLNKFLASVSSANGVMS